MHIEYHKWWSPSLNKDMELKVYGHYGKPYIAFPCSWKQFYDYEESGMINAISHFINSGKIKIFAINNIDTESWYNFSILPGDRNNRYEDYDRYIINELVPFIHNHCNTNERIMTNGMSLGAYYALNTFLKHPDIFEGVIALSGLYRLNRYEFGLQDYDIPYVYFNSPINYLPGNNDSWFIDKYRQSNIILCVGQGPWEAEALEDTRAMHHIFMEKGIPAWVEYWGYDVAHHWYWWYKQMNYFLGHLYG